MVDIRSRRFFLITVLLKGKTYKEFPYIGYTFPFRSDILMSLQSEEDEVVIINIFEFKDVKDYYSYCR